MNEFVKILFFAEREDYFALLKVEQVHYVLNLSENKFS